MNLPEGHGYITNNRLGIWSRMVNSRYITNNNDMYTNSVNGLS